MSKRLDETIGAVGFDNLINGQYPPAEVFTVKIRKEATEAKIYKRGTVLALSADTAGDACNSRYHCEKQRDADGQLRAG